MQSSNFISLAALTDPGTGYISNSTEKPSTALNRFHILLHLPPSFKTICESKVISFQSASYPFHTSAAFCLQKKYLHLLKFDVIDSTINYRTKLLKSVK